MRFRSTKDEEPTISIAPLIDIVFLLLIFFMVTSHFDIASGVRINLPDITKKVTEDNGETKVTLIIDKSGRVFLGGEEIDSQALSDRLRADVKKDSFLHVILQADKDVSHGRVVEIMDLVKNAGVRSIIIAARWKAGEQL